ncbi:MAG: response regulator [Gemmataceae bacterium]
MRNLEGLCAGQDAPGLASTLFQLAGEAHLLVDPLTARVTEANEAACKLGQVPRQELLGELADNLLVLERATEGVGPLNPSRFGLLHEPYLFKPTCGTRGIPVQVRIDRVLNAAGELVVLITLARRGEPQRTAQMQRLESLGRLAGRVAHDFNNLITGILGHVSLMRLELRESGIAPVSLEQIEGTALRVASLCKQLNTIAGKSSSHGFIADPAHLLRSVLHTLEACVPLHVRLHVQVDDDLPPLRLDAEELGLLVEMLVRNAVEACSDAEQAGEIVIRLGREWRPGEGQVVAFSFRGGEHTAPMLCLEVRDNGPGIPRDVQAHLGEPFVSPHGSHRGLGLALVLGVLRAHRGELQIHTQPGLGTTVRALLPMSLSAVLGTGTTTQPPASQPRTSINVLLVDDEQMVRDVTSRLLQSLGHKVVSVSSGEEALHLAKTPGSTFHLALIDLTMPTMSGETTARELRRRLPTLPIILVSGYPEHDLPSRFADLPVAGFLQKPYRLPALSALIAQVQQTMPT